MELTSATYKSTLMTITERIRQGQYNALQAVNNELIALYRDVGETVFRARELGKWGDDVIGQLAKDISIRNPGVKGFSRSNLFSMVRFYQAYRASKKIQTLSGQISWSHNVLILEKCSSNQEVEYYMGASAKYGWSHQLLKKKIVSHEYQRSRIGQNNFGLLFGKGSVDSANLVIKDQYIFDFLELKDNHSEEELELSIVQNIEKFLIEMSNSLLFVSRQYKIKIGRNDYFLDLLLYHRLLRCFVVVELKVSEFKPEHIGKMSFYLTAIDKQLRSPDENRSIGILICKEKSRTLVEYTLADINKPMAVATYKSHADLPESYARYLPDEKELSESLLSMDS